MLIAEDLMLLVLEDLSGRPSRNLDLWTLDLLVGGALVSELALCGAVRLHVDPRWHSLEVHPTGVLPPADPCLERSLARAQGRPRPATLVRSCGIKMFEHLVDRLVHRGLLREVQEKRLIGTRTVWPATDVTYKEEARRHLLATLVHGVHPSQRTAALIGLLASVDQTAQLLVTTAATPAFVRLQADHIAASDWVATGVRTAYLASGSGRRSFGSGGGGGDWGGGDWGGGD